MASDDLTNNRIMVPAIILLVSSQAHFTQILIFTNHNDTKQNTAVCIFYEIHCMLFISPSHLVVVDIWPIELRAYVLHFVKNKNIYFYSLSFHCANVVHLVEIPSHRRQGSVYHV